MAAPVDQATLRVQGQIRKWRDDLINLTRSNRLLYFRQTKTSTLAIQQPSASELLARLKGESSKGLPFYEPPEDDTEKARPLLPGVELARQRPPNGNHQFGIVTQCQDRETLLTILRNLDRRTTQEYIDKGLWTLYIGVGMLQWKGPEEDGTITSPLYLVPVSVRRDNIQSPFRLRRADEDPAMNPALAVKLEQDFGIDLPTLDEIEDDDISVIFKSMEEAVVRQNGWRVTPEVVLASFSFHKEVMYRDLIANESEVVAHPLVRSLVSDATRGSDFQFDPIPEDQLDELSPPEEMATILDADASQRQCIAAARSGQSFVMDGPPGTGKSQTIANVIADLLAHNKTVLFVSEKAAALEVVQARLQQAGLSEFLLELHSHKATRKEVAQTLGTSLTTRVKPAGSMRPVEVQTLRTLRGELSAYAAALNEVRPSLGQALHSVIGRICSLQYLPHAPHPPGIGAKLSAEELSSVLAGAAALARAWGPVDRADDFLWRDLLDCSFDLDRKFQATDACHRGRTALDELRPLVSGLVSETGLGWNAGAADAKRWAELGRSLKEAPPVPACWLSAHSLGGYIQLVALLEELAVHYAATVAELQRLVGDRWSDLDPTAHPSLDRELTEAGIAKLPITDESARRDLLRLEEALAGSAQQCARLKPDVELVAGTFDVELDTVCLSHANALAAIGELVTARHRPEGSWLDEHPISDVRATAAKLEGSVLEWENRRQEAIQFFRPDILKEDLEALNLRFEKVHVGIRRLTAAYRADKRLLRQYTLTTRVRRRDIKALSKALAWKKADDDLQRIDTESRPVLGSYCKRQETDFTASGAALALAEDVLRQGEGLVSRESLRKVFTCDQPVDQALLQASRQICKGFKSWQSTAAETLGEGLWNRLTALTPEAAALSASAAEALTHRIGQHLDHAASGSGNAAVNIGMARSWFSLRADAQKTIDDFHQSERRATDELGPQFNGLGTDWAAVRRALAWADGVRVQIAAPVKPEVAAALLAVTIDVAKLEKIISEWTKATDHLFAQFQEGHGTKLRTRAECGFEEGHKLLQRLADTVADILEWAAFSQAMSDLAALGVADPAAYCAQKRVEAAEAAGMIERSVLEKWTDSVIEEDDRLKVLRPLDRDERIAQFTDLDRRLIQLSANSVIETCNARRPRNVAGVAGIIAREAQKQRRHRPVRQLMSEAAPVIQALKPCFMMSPLSVSQFLPPTMRFDVVIFDEASQVRPPDAINCIYRGRQLIVAGDQRQLPPTSFFEAVGHGDSDEWVPDEPEDFESILDVAKGCGGFSSLSLNWHYRSQHEDLITFSNYQFYQGKLITFPGSNTIGPDLGVELFVVPGVYRRGGARDNPIEVQKVVERVKHHRRNHSHLTLGVVAFSEAQASAIDAEISRHAELQDYFNDDRLQGGFVKNLETVQGDERDIIIFSVGYGPDEVGKFTMNFGPINRQGGWRRLNVAITRARRRIEVVSSVTHAKFSDATDSEGVRHLRRYLDFAGRTDNRVAALEVPLVESCGDVESPFEDEVLRTVRGWGYEVVPQAGCAGYRIDLAIRSPDRDGGFALGIECDGAMYHSSRVARDRDRLRQEVLERLGWRLHRIWGPAWYRSRAEQETRLKNAIEEATRGTAAHVAPPPVAPTGNGGSIQIDPEVPPEWTELYRPARPGPPGRNAQIYDTGPYGDLRRMVREVIATEGPVSPEVVLRRVRDAFGIQRAGSRVREAFDATVRALRTTNVVVRDPNGFLYEAGRTLTQVRRPNPSEPESIRSVAEVPRSELELAIECMVRDASAIDEDELTARVASLFGWTRRGQDIDAELRRAVRDLLRRGTIERGPHGLRPRDGS